MKKLLLIISFLLPILSATANAFILQANVDSCAYIDGPGERYFGTPSICRTSFNQGEGIAYQFHLDSDYTIESISGSMFRQDNDPFQIEGATQNLVIFDGSLLTHAGNVPDISNKVFEQQFSFSEDDQQNYDWHGVNNVNVDLHPGEYWIAFEDGKSGTYVQQGIQFGVAGTPDRMGAIATPECPTWAYLLIAFTGLFFMQARKRQNLYGIR